MNLDAVMRKKKYEGETNVDGIERMEAEILSNGEEEEIYGNVPVNNDDNDNYGDEDNEGLHPGRGLEEMREPNVQDTDGVIHEVVDTADLLSAEQREVRVILRMYQKSFSSTPGLCVKFEYGFELTDHAPFSYRVRPIPYAIRDAVREQIEMMVRHH
jgi:hypothetical protein